MPYLAVSSITLTILFFFLSFWCLFVSESTIENLFLLGLKSLSSVTFYTRQFMKYRRGCQLFVLVARLESSL